ncbi:hypothetical protein D3875_02825 [Deinococcus cavernae]|uniref:Uncharacterized protein n=1 Tax=Deinococcus cavernae TaxID=2320857 RepID=A0A418VFX8_9DEIO|nr:hypothetical protein [Deinococcus cavernae]RJF74946.1 hypothetical protein D3875_02825 [Deinococcus cavernae]
MQHRQRVTDTRLLLQVTAQARDDYVAAVHTLGRATAQAAWWDDYSRALKASLAAQDDLQEHQRCALDRLGLTTGGLT